MNPLEQQLKRLCEVDSTFYFEEDSTDLYCDGTEPTSTLRISPDGQLQGGEALWWMFTQMQDRLHELDLPDKDEIETLWPLMGTEPPVITADLILSTYIQWKEATAKVEQ